MDSLIIKLREKKSIERYRDLNFESRECDRGKAKNGHSTTFTRHVAPSFPRNEKEKKKKKGRDVAKGRLKSK